MVREIFRYALLKKKEEFCGQTEAWVKAGFPPVSEFPAPLIC